MKYADVVARIERAAKLRSGVWLEFEAVELLRVLLELGDGADQAKFLDEQGPE